MANRVELQKKLDEVQGKLSKVFAEAGDDLDLAKVSCIEGSTLDKAKKIGAMNKDAAELKAQIEAAVNVEEIAAAHRKKLTENADPNNVGDNEIDHSEGFVQPMTEAGKRRKEIDVNLGAQVVKSGVLKTMEQSKHFDVPVKTLFETTAGWAPESTRSGRLLLDAQRPIEVIDIVPGGTISQDTYKYMEETTFTNNAAEVAEGGTYAESALALTERSQVVEKVGTWIPVTDEQMEDVAGIESYVNGRLMFMVRQRLDSQLLVGNGTTPNILGFNNKTGIQTQALGTDARPDAFYKAMDLVRVTGRANPTAIIMHPNDWQPIRLLKTADGIYIWGNPADAGPERLFGLPVVQTTAQTEGTGLVGDFVGHSLFLIRRGLDVQVTNSHSTFFIEGKKAIRADIRCVLVIFRPEAFCQVTGI